MLTASFLGALRKRFVTYISSKTPIQSDNLQSGSLQIQQLNDLSTSDHTDDRIKPEMAQNLNEHSRSLSFLTSPQHDSRAYERTLAENVSLAEHDLQGTGDVPDQATHDAAVAARMQEMERLKKVWDEMNAKNESRDSQK